MLYHFSNNYLVGEKTKKVIYRLFTPCITVYAIETIWPPYPVSLQGTAVWPSGPAVCEATICRLSLLDYRSLEEGGLGAVGVLEALALEGIDPQLSDWCQESDCCQTMNLQEEPEWAGGQW